MRKNSETGRSASTLGGIALGGLLGTTILCGAAPALAVSEGDVLDLSGLERVTDTSLDDLRGGFRVGAFDISFGVQVTTSVNGQDILQTSFNVLHPGMPGQTTTTMFGGNVNVNAATFGGQGVGQAAPQGATGQDPAGSTGGGAAGGFQPASAAPLPSGEAAASNTGGWTFTQTDNGVVQATSADFATTIMHQIDSAVTASIANSADNQTIANDTQLDLFINNFETVQMQSVTNQVISGTMTEMMNAGALGN
jgi:hypothetical protein